MDRSPQPPQPHYPPRSGPPVPRRLPPRPPEGRGLSVSSAFVAAILLALSAAALFAAGLSLGGQTGGRGAEERAAIESFVETYRRISDQYVGEASPEALIEGAIRGMFETLDDPYSSYLGPDEFDATLSGISGQFEGIGAVMSAEDASGEACTPIRGPCQLRITEVLPASPALAAGLQEDDIVRAVDGRPLSGQTIDDAVLLIRGPRGSDVTLTLDRDGEARQLTITRDVIVSEDVRAAVLADGQVGYLRIDSFSRNAAEHFESALREHLDAGIRRLVLDVRDDPGGFVDAAVGISSQFLSHGPVFWEEDAAGAQRSIEVVGGGLATRPDIRLVVLVDDGTASASEILAGALQADGRATLVGEQTFGKGTIQEWTELPGEHGGFRLSVAKWLTRDKTWIHGVGLTPDVVVAEGGRFRPDGDDADISIDPQLARAVALLVEEAEALATVERPALSAVPAA